MWEVALLANPVTCLWPCWWDHVGQGRNSIMRCQWLELQLSISLWVMQKGDPCIHLGYQSGVGRQGAGRGLRGDAAAA